MLNEIKNPSPAEVVAICDDLRKTLLDALTRGHTVTVSRRSQVSEVYDEGGGYGRMPVDLMVDGVRWQFTVLAPGKVWKGKRPPAA